MPNYDFFDRNPYGTHMKVLNLVSKNKRVLEIGCSTGQISRKLSENGCEVVGVELNEELPELRRSTAKR